MNSPTAMLRTLSLDESLQEAVTHHRAGQLKEAEEIYRAILHVQPTHPDANHNLGVVAMQMEHPAMGLPYLKAALEANPSNGHYWLSYIEALIQTGQIDTARQTLEDGRQRGLHGAETEALATRLGSRQALPENRDTEHQGRYAEAMKLHQTGKVQEAKEIYLSLMHLFPDQPDLLRWLGTAENQLGNLHEGIELLSRSIQLEPHHPEAQNNLGNAFLELGRFNEALASYDQAIRLFPEYVEAYTNRGSVLWKLGQWDEALASFEKAFELRPDDAGICVNLGNKLEKLGRSTEALEKFDRAIRLRPDDIDACWNKAHLKLRAGEWQEGWQLFEKRWELWARKGNRHVMKFSVPLWTGDASLQGKIILLHAEQGIGDTLQFYRYVKRVSALGAKIVLAVPQPLVRLLDHIENSNPLITIISDGDKFPEFDIHCPLMSLPLALKTTTETIPAEIPYLKSNPVQSADWKKRLGESTRLRVGLAWSSGHHPNQPDLWSDHARRNIPLAKLESLNIPDVEFYSLQKGEDGETQLKELVAAPWRGPKIIDLTQELTDFSDTAALIDNLDLVISVDTSVAHLAGAMGKPVWIMTRFDACWRWLKDRSDSPWYPTAVLYRQSSFDDWSTVVTDIRTQLEIRAKAHRDTFLSPPAEIKP